MPTRAISVPPFPDIHLYMYKYILIVGTWENTIKTHINTKRARSKVVTAGSIQLVGLGIIVLVQVLSSCLYLIMKLSILIHLASL